MRETQSTLRLRGLVETPDPADEVSNGTATIVTTIPTRAGGTAASSRMAIAVPYELLSTVETLVSHRRWDRRFARNIRLAMEMVTRRLTRTEEPAVRTIMAGEGMLLPLLSLIFQGFTGCRLFLPAQEYFPEAMW
jgi:hypothetical protein